jgi:hypothetical protein
MRLSLLVSGGREKAQMAWKEIGGIDECVVGFN